MSDLRSPENGIVTQALKRAKRQHQMSKLRVLRLPSLTSHLTCQRYESGGPHVGDLRALGSSGNAPGENR